MGTLIEIRYGEQSIYLEADDAVAPLAPSAIEEAGALDPGALAIKRAERLTSSIWGLCDELIAGREGLTVEKPTKTTIEFAVGVSLQGNVYVAKGSGSASIKVTAEWT